MENRKISVIKDLNKNSIVIINDIIIKGKKTIKWKEVEQHLKKNIGKFYNY